jgi:hypothetical protein
MLGKRSLKAAAGERSGTIRVPSERESKEEIGPDGLDPPLRDPLPRSCCWEQHGIR